MKSWIGWFWVCRVRQGKSLKFANSEDWLTVKDFIPQVKEKTTNYEQVLLTRHHEYYCRLVTTRRSPRGRTWGVTLERCAQGCARRSQGCGFSKNQVASRAFLPRSRLSVH